MLLYARNELKPRELNHYPPLVINEKVETIEEISLIKNKAIKSFINYLKFKTSDIFWYFNVWKVGFSFTFNSPKEYRISGAKTKSLNLFSSPTPKSMAKSDLLLKSELVKDSFPIGSLKFGPKSK